MEREQLTAEGFSFQWFLYAQLRERFKVDKGQEKKEFEAELFTTMSI